MFSSEVNLSREVRQSCSNCSILLITIIAKLLKHNIDISAMQYLYCVVMVVVSSLVSCVVLSLYDEHL